jgi:hypothetical protein
MEIEADVIPEVQTERVSLLSGVEVVVGQVAVTNTSNRPVEYGNGYLYLQAADLPESRTYSNTVATMVVDIGTVTVAPGERQEFDVVWKFEGASGSVDVSSVRLDTLGLKNAAALLVR